MSFLRVFSYTVLSLLLIWFLLAVWFFIRLSHGSGY
jgi:hypothetical protein